MLKNSQWSQNHKAQAFCPAFWDIIRNLSFQLSLLPPPQWSTFLIFLDSTSLLLPFPFLFARELPHPKRTPTHTLKTQQKCLFSLPAWEGLLSLLTVSAFYLHLHHPSRDQLFLSCICYFPISPSGIWAPEEQGFFYHSTSNWHSAWNIQALNKYFWMNEYLCIKMWIQLSTLQMIKQII